MKFAIGDEIWVRDKVRSTAESEPSVLPENGVWRDSRDIVAAAPHLKREQEASPGDAELVSTWTEPPKGLEFLALGKSSAAQRALDK